ncbi:MAG: hypothetical protein RBR74_12845 [Ignavibacteriaceae bacterium]|jgi:hypothetical protein|nr:hypothetical protein [Ignavibacteriaceae bacterium]
MKKISAFCIILLLFSYSCKDSVNEPQSNSTDFFPSSDGNYYEYSVSVSDTNGSMIQSGSRKSYYTGDTIIFNIKHQIKVDTFQIGNLQTIKHSYFVKEPFGVFNFVDIETNGFKSLLPDSLRGSFSIPLQYPFVTNSLEVNETWHLIEAWAGIPEFQLFNVEAEVVSLDTLFIQEQSITRFTEAYNVKYKARLSTGMNEPPKLLEAHGWFAKGIGPVKWEGNSGLINFFAGDEIYPHNTIVLEEVKFYRIR